MLHHNAKASTDKASARRAALIAPPQLDPADVVSALTDIETWKKFESLSENQKQEAWQSYRVVYALARSPSNIMPKQVAPGILGKRAEETHAEELASLAADIAAADELLRAAASMRTALQQIKGELSELTTAADIAAQLRAAREGVPLESVPGSVRRKAA